MMKTRNTLRIGKAKLVQGIEGKEFGPIIFPQSRITDHDKLYIACTSRNDDGELDHLINFLEKADLAERIKNIDLNNND